MKILKTFVIMLFSNLIYSQSDVPVTLRAQFNGSYGYTIIGNTHNEFDNYSVPSPTCQVLTQSTATLNLASNQSIVAAYLYWGGMGDGTYNPTIKLNGTSYNATQSFVSYPESNNVFSYFNNFVNITNQVIATGNGNYTFSDIDLNPIIFTYCSNGVYNLGWHIVIVYNQINLVSNQLNVYDGNNIVNNQFNNGQTNVDINNLNIIDSQSAKMTYVALNGSPNLFFNESIKFNGNTLSNTLNPANNPFNGTNSFTNSTTNWNQDIDTFDISPYINIGDTQANLGINSVFVRFIQTIVTSIRSELPDATAAIAAVTGQNVCNNRDLVVNYTVSNNNSNAVLPSNVPVSFYANNVLLQTVNTTTSIAIGGSLNLQTTVTIPAGISGTFVLKIIVDSSATGISTIAESNENNNENAVSVTLASATITPTFSIANTFCKNAIVPVLPLTSNNSVAGSWSPSTIDNQASGSYVFTPAANSCATNFTLSVTINQLTTPTFTITNTFCKNAVVPVLPLTSNNSIAGTWSPSTIDNQASGNYVFSPAANSCAATFTLSVSITQLTTPTFAITNTFCKNAIVPVLPLTSNNSISGTWSPSTIDNQASGNYVFAPAANSCAANFTLSIIINQLTTPTFTIANTFCKNSVVPVLPLISNNAVAGTWSPSTIDNQASGNYVFSPAANSCASPFTLNVSITAPTTTNIDKYICLNDFGVALSSIVLNTNLSATNFTINWTKDNTAINSNQSALTISEFGIYQAVATNIASGCVKTFIFNVKAVRPMINDFVVSDDFSENQTITVQTSGGSGQYEYSFNNEPFQLEASFEAQDGGDVSIKVRDRNNCYEVSKTITVWQYPKFFTPNNDVVNDFWLVKTNKKIRIDIFDRFGKLIKELKKNEFWDGTFNNINLAANDYWFVIYYDENKIYKSHFALKR